MTIIPSKILLACALMGCSAFAADAQTRAPNILVLMTDQLSADAISSAGNRHVRTPNIDRLAAKGVRFDLSYCTSPLCTPSRASLFTGLYPHQAGIVVNNLELDGERHPTMGRQLADAGYDAAYAGKWHIAHGYPGTTATGIPGFTVLPIAAPPPSRIDKDKDGYGLTLDSPTADAAITYLRHRPPGKPFVLVTSFLNPHDICEFPGSSALRRLLPDDPSALPPLRTNHDGPRELPSKASSSKKHFSVWSEREWQEYQWVYYRLVESVDRQVGRVLDALEESGQAGNTLVVFTADHGDMQGAHRFAGKCLMYEESSRVPLIIAAPGMTPGIDGKHLVSGVDLIPTLLDYAGAKSTGNLSGRSLRPILAGKDVPWRDHVIAQLFSGVPAGLNIRMVRTARYKYIVFNLGEHREQFFDLETDPGERADLIADQSLASEIVRHRALFDQWMHESGDDWDARRFVAPKASVATP
jgi:arylsulfatase A-like enzyme